MSKSASEETRVDAARRRFRRMRDFEKQICAFGFITTVFSTVTVFCVILDLYRFLYTLSLLGLFIGSAISMHFIATLFAKPTARKIAERREQYHQH